MKSIFAAAAVAAFAGAASANVQITEILGSTGGSDLEFIEISNTGNLAVDITGWSIELWDSDSANIGTQDGGAPYFVTGNVVLAPGESYVWGNQAAIDAWTGGSFNGASYATDYFGFGFSVDSALPSNAIENSSYTAVLADAASSALDAWFFSDGDSGDFANRNGAAITPSVVPPLDGGGQFLNSGWSLFDTTGDGNLDFAGDLAFSTPGFGTPFLGEQDVLSGGTPGQWQIPAPGAAALLGFAGVAAARRRRA